MGTFSTTIRIELANLAVDSKNQTHLEEKGVGGLTSVISVK